MTKELNISDIQDLENQMLTRQRKGKRDRCKQRMPYLDRLYKWLEEHSLRDITKRLNLLRPTTDKEL